MSGRQALVAALWASTRRLASPLPSNQSSSHSANGGHDLRSLLIGNGVRHIRTHTKHKVILISPIERLGEAGQIVKVAPGYARNRLIPNKLALPAIDKFVLLIQERLKQAGTAKIEDTVEKAEIKEETEEEKLKAVDVVLGRLAKGRVVIRRDVGMRTTLLKLVTKSDVLNEVKRQLGVELHEDNLILESAFSEVGDFDVLLRLPEGLKLPGDKTKMVAIGDDSEADALMMLALDKVEKSIGKTLVKDDATGLDAWKLGIDERMLEKLGEEAEYAAAGAGLEGPRNTAMDRIDICKRRGELTIDVDPKELDRRTYL